MDIVTFNDGLIIIDSEGNYLHHIGRKFVNTNLNYSDYILISYDKYINSPLRPFIPQLKNWRKNYNLRKEQMAMPTNMILTQHELAMQQQRDFQSIDRTKRNKIKGNKMKKDNIKLKNLYTTEGGYIFAPTKIKSDSNKLEGALLTKYSFFTNTNKWTEDIHSEFNILEHISNKYKSLGNKIKDLKITYLVDTESLLFIDSEFKIENLKLEDSIFIEDIVEHVKKSFNKIEKTIKAGAEVSVEHIIIEEVEPEVEINTSGSNIVEQYASIVSNVSEITKSINAGSALDNHKEIADAFVKAKKEISKLSEVKPTRFGYLGKLLINNNIIKSTVENAKEEKTRNQSTQDNIDYLFGVVYEKYEILIQTGKGLQASKLQMKKQVEALEELSKDSTSQLESFVDKTDIPMDILAIDTQIKTSIQKYKQRLTKIDGAIIATQTTITSLAKDLPAMKNDLTDEMAISTLLGSVDDYQVMYGEIASLVSEVTTATAEKTHVVIENLLDLQINDTHTMKYLVDSGQRAEKLATMLTDKTGKLAKKVTRDAQFIGDIAKGNSIEHARKNYKLLN